MFEIFKIIFAKDNIDLIGNEGRETGIYGSLFFVLIAAILTGLNIYKQYTFMAITTTVLLFGFIVAAIFAIKDKVKVSRVITAILCAVVFSVYAIIGGNYGFAILWILLIPIIGTLLVGLKIGFFISLYFQIFLVVLFYTPLSVYIGDYYSSTFIMRFPLLYFASFGAIIFLMCQRQKLFNQVHKLAFYDGLTDLYNRRYYNEIMEKNENGNQKVITVLSLDVDRLKYVNDTIGHAAGDELLIGAADLIKRFFSEDECCRIGGDEFAVICQRSAREVYASVDSFEGEMEKWRGTLVNDIHISVGFASSDENPELNISELFKLADQKMYDQKRTYYAKIGIERK